MSKIDPQATVYQSIGIPFRLHAALTIMAGMYAREPAHTCRADRIAEYALAALVRM